MTSLNRCVLCQVFPRTALVLSVLGISLVAAQPLAEQPEHHAESGAHRVFDNPEAYAESWDDPARDAWQRPSDLVVALGVRTGMTVADIGTGTGYLLPHLSEAVGANGKVFAVDISPEMLTWVAERAQREGLTNVTTVQASGERSGLAEESIDRAIMINVWHHVANQEDYAVDLFQSLRAGGTLFIVEAKPDATHEGSPPRHFRLQPEAVVAQLAQAGFKARVDEFVIDRQFVVRAEK